VKIATNLYEEHAWRIICESYFLYFECTMHIPSSYAGSMLTSKHTPSENIYYISIKAVCLSVYIPVKLYLQLLHTSNQFFSAFHLSTCTFLVSCCTYWSSFCAKQSTHHQWIKWHLNEASNCPRLSFTGHWMKECRGKLAQILSLNCK